MTASFCKERWGRKGQEFHPLIQEMYQWSRNDIQITQGVFVFIITDTFGRKRWNSKAWLKIIRLKITKSYKWKYYKSVDPWSVVNS